MSELQTGNIKSIVRQGHQEVIVELYEFPFTWPILKAEIQNELNMKIKDTFKVLESQKVKVWIAGGKR